MIKQQYTFICNNCGIDFTIPFKENIQSKALARAVAKMNGWEYKGGKIDICPDCVKAEYRHQGTTGKQQRNLSITLLHIRGMSMHKLAKRYHTSAQRIHDIIHREINKKKADLSKIPGFLDSQESSFLKRCLQFKEKTISILRR